MLTLQAVGEHNGASLIVKPEVIPKSSPEGNEWDLETELFGSPPAKGVK